MATDKHRPWRVIADEIANETDTKRIIELTDEMNAAIEEQGINEDSVTCLHCLGIIRAQAPYAEQVLRRGSLLGVIHSGCIKDWQKEYPDDTFVPLEC